MTTLTWTTLFTNQNLTQTQFITNVRSRFDEDSADNVSDAQLQQFIISGLDNIAFKAKLFPEFATATADGSTYYNLPSTNINIGEVVWVDTNSKEIPLTKSSPSNADAMTYSTASAKFYSIEGTRLYLFGAPSSGTIKVYGTRPPLTPANNSAYIDLPNRYMEGLYSWCEWKYWTRRREPDEAAQARQLYFDGVQQIKEDIEEELMHGVALYGKKSQRV